MNTKFISHYWYNYVTEKYENIPTPKDFSDYIPQDATVLNLYRCYIEMGIEPINAAKNVLLLWVGGTKDE